MSRNKKKRNKNKKVGRNQRCPCGSGLKFKKCHGAVVESLSDSEKNIDKNEWETAMERLKAKEIQRQAQQGKGKEVVSCEHKGFRMVAIGGQVLYSKLWKTFHDFLLSYLKSVFGESWWENEERKKSNSRHPILNWLELIQKKRKLQGGQKEQVQSAKMSGAEAAYLRLSYFLYLSAHNVRLQEQLIKRLKNIEQFYPAYYETFIASRFILAGFAIDFEDEGDPVTSHCEFIATNKKTNKKFSVEAKYRMPDKPHAKVANQLRKALGKKSAFERIVFIEMNIDEQGPGSEMRRWMHEAINDLREAEGRLKINGKEAPPAYVVLTNNASFYHLEDVKFDYSCISEGFKIPELKHDYSCTLEEAISNDESHKEILELIDSLKEFRDIPATFDGEAPEFTFGEGQNRLLIGNRYEIPGSEGVKLIGSLEEAIVIEKECAAYCVFLLESGKRHLYMAELSSNEMAAYRRHPETFFGKYKQGNRQASNPKEFYDFLYETYQHSTREKLLEFLKGHPEYEKLQEKGQEELAKIYCLALARRFGRR